MLKHYRLFQFFVFQIVEMKNMLERPFSKSFSGFRESGLRDAKWPDPLSAGSPISRVLISSFRAFGTSNAETPKFTFGQFNSPDLIGISGFWVS
jgi:hypothetical protein